MFARSITARAGVAANAASRQSIIMARQPGFSLGARAVRVPFVDSALGELD